MSNAQALNTLTALPFPEKLVAIKIYHRGFEVSLTTERLPQTAVFEGRHSRPLRVWDGTEGHQVREALSFIDRVVSWRDKGIRYEEEDIGVYTTLYRWDKREPADNFITQFKSEGGYYIDQTPLEPARDGEWWTVRVGFDAVQARMEMRQ